MHTPKQIVIIPTYNEMENIERMVDTVMQIPNIEILVVDDNSPDGTAKLVESKQNLYKNRLHLLNRSEKSGLGTAYIAGFKWCLQKDYTYIAEMDCDFSHNPTDLPKLIAFCEQQQAQVAVGSRYVGGVINVVNWPMGRVLLSYYASKYVRLITGMQVWDTTAGFVCYHKSVLQAINLDKIQFRGYAFQIEMKFKAIKHGFVLKEMPIIFTDRTAGTSKMSKGIIKEALFGVIKLRLQAVFKRLI